MKEKENFRNDLLEVDGVVLTPVPSTKVTFSDYLVDTINGRIWSKKSNKWMSTNPNENGYVYVYIIDDEGANHGYGTHRLVMSSYSGIPIEQFCRGRIEIDHIDEDLTHINGIHNLQMTDRKGQYAKESTLERMRKSKPRLKEHEALEIIEQLYELKNNEDFKISEFIKMMCETYDREYRGMYNLVTGKSFKHLHNQLESTV